MVPRHGEIDVVLKSWWLCENCEDVLLESSAFLLLERCAEEMPYKFFAIVRRVFLLGCSWLFWMPLLINYKNVVNLLGVCFKSCDGFFVHGFDEDRHTAKNDHE